MSNIGEEKELLSWTVDSSGIESYDKAYYLFLTIFGIIAFSFIILRVFLMQEIDYSKAIFRISILIAVIIIMIIVGRYSLTRKRIYKYVMTENSISKHLMYENGKETISSKFIWAYSKIFAIKFFPDTNKWASYNYYKTFSKYRIEGDKIFLKRRYPTSFLIVEYVIVLNKNKDKVVNILKKNNIQLN